MTICDGLTVIEMGAGSAPAAIVGMVLADFGARVIKIEPPEGDRLRTQAPSAWRVWNRGKESLVADLRTPAGQATVAKLAANADIVLEGFSPGVAESFGVGSDILSADNTGLIYASFSAFGSSGELAGVKGYEALVAAKCGLFDRGSFAPRPGPILFPQLSGCYGAAMQMVGGLAGALITRDRTARGQRLDATLVQGLDPLDYFTTAIWQITQRAAAAAGKNGEKVDNRSGPMAFSRYGLLLVSADGRIVQTTTVLPHQGKALIEALGAAHVLTTPQYAKMPMFDTADDAQAFEDLMLEQFRKKTLAEWIPILMAYEDIPFEIGCTSEEGLDHPQIVHNGNAIIVDDPEVGPVRQIGPLANFTKTPAIVRRAAPELGDNDGGFSVRPPLAPRPSGDPATPRPLLDGITIVEFGYFYAMPFGLALAADLGARVIKIEDGEGDPMRRSFGPELGSVKTTGGKQSISLNLRTPKGQQIAQQLAAGANVFVTGFRTGVADRLGLGYETLSKLNPRLVYLHATGYGVDGPYASRGLYAQAAQAVAGSFGRQVGSWVAPERNVGLSVMELQAVIMPRLNMIIDGDSNAALSVFATLGMALWHQHRTGEGQFVSTSMIGGNALAYSDDFCTYAGKPPLPTVDEENMGLSPWYRLYEAAEGWICLAVPTPKEQARFAAAVGRDDLVDGTHNDGELIAGLTDVFRTASAQEWESRLRAVDVGCVAVHTDVQSQFTCTNSVMRATGRSYEVEHPLFGSMIRSGPPVDASSSPARVASGCLRGQHNELLLRDLGYTDGEIADLVRDQVVFAS